MRKARKPRWWLLNLLVVGIGVALYLQIRVELSAVMRQIVLVGTIALAYLLIANWVWLNRMRLEQESSSESPTERAIYEDADVERTPSEHEDVTQLRT